MASVCAVQSATNFCNVNNNGNANNWNASNSIGVRPDFTTAPHSTGKLPRAAMGKERPSVQRDQLVNANQDAPGYDRWGYRVVFMNVFYDANLIYDAGTKAMKSSKFKRSTQLFEMNHYAKIVRGIKHYARYTDDFYAVSDSKEFLVSVLEGFRKEAAEYGLIINEKKTRIVKLSSQFRHLQVCYSLTESGRLIRKIHPKNITRERRKLKAYKRLLDAGRIDYPTVENSFKSWLGSHYKIMSHDQIYNMSSLYYELFGRRPKWKKGHGRLHWLMAHPSTASTSTGTTTSAPPPSPRTPSPASSPA